MNESRLPAGLDRLSSRLLIIGFWTLIGVLETAKEITTARLSGADRTVADAIIVNFPWWFFWVPASVLVIWLAHRWPVDQTPRAKALIAHTAVAAVVALAHMALVAFFTYYGVVRGLRPDATWLEQFQYWISAYLVLDFLVYWMVLGAHHALVYHRRLADGRLREVESRARTADLEAIAADARLHALQMELNPHFLFNSLNSVSGLVESGDAARATTMIARLADLLRRTLDRGHTTEISLEEEFTTLERYLWIEQVRFGDRLEIDAQLDPALSRGAIPPMLLQPLAENALRHGIAERPGKGSLRVRATRQGDQLVVTVEDDGAGIDPGFKPGVGLANVRDRLSLAYGDRGKLDLRTREGGGTVATVQLPWRPLTDENEEGAG